MSRRAIFTLVGLACAPLSVAHAQTSPPPCEPCSGPGGCAPNIPIVSGQKHKCENHGGLTYTNEMWLGNNMKQIMFSSGDLSGTTFFGCDLTKANLYNVNLDGGGVTVSSARLSVFIDATLTNCDLTETNFKEARMSRANFTSSVLSGSSFLRARLNDADFTAARLSGGFFLADFSGADLSGAVGLADTIGIAMYDGCTDFSGTGFDPVAAGWIAAPIGTNYCTAVPNSTGVEALITAVGCLDVSENSFSLTASDLPANQFGYFLGSQTQDFVMNPGGSQGNLCVGGTVGRFVNDIQNSGDGGTFTISVDLENLPPPLSEVMPGDTWNFTAWYRDVNPTTTSNFTNGVSVTFE